MKLSVKLAVLSTVLAMNMMSHATTASACGENPQDGFLPQNSLNIPPRRNVILDRNGAPLGGGITEAEFNAVISSVEKIYAPVVASMGGQLNIQRNWNDGTVNAYASREGKIWNVAMFGGLARHKETTPDGFMLVVCHELGHHIGGAPKYNRGRGNEWASNEGESDYFATLKCARRVLETTNARSNMKILKMVETPDVVMKACGNPARMRGLTARDAQICARSAMGGLSLARLLNSIGREVPEDKMPFFTKIDTSTVSKTYDAHPAAQCRLDTYFNGAICEVDHNEPVDDKDPTIATCSQEKGAKFGFRPRCWYAPQGVNETARPVSSVRPRHIRYF